MVEQRESLVAYCGLYCGECFIGRGEIADRATQLLGKFEEVDFQRVAAGLAGLFDEFETLAHYPECRHVLRAVAGLRCPSACKEGGGSASCKIRECCRSKELEGCWLCDEFPQCETLAWLQPVNGDAHLKNLSKIREEGMERFLDGTKCW